MTYHARREFFVPKLQHFLSFNVTQAEQMMSLLLVNNFYPMISHRRVQRKKKATNYCIRFGHSLWSANQLPAQGVKSELFVIHNCDESTSRNHVFNVIVKAVPFDEFTNRWISTTYTYIQLRYAMNIWNNCLNTWRWNFMNKRKRSKNGLEMRERVVRRAGARLQTKIKQGAETCL